MRKILISIVTFLSVAGLASPGINKKHLELKGMPELRLIAFDDMYAVDGPFVGEAHAIRGVIGDELPWVLHSARGTLSKEGRLQIKVRGLVFADEASVPPQLRGINDEATFRALVSCESESAGEEAIITNVTTAGFPASVSGNSNIDARIDLPNPCIAPVVFVLSGSEDKWFAVDGVESGS